jgi:hypothetical protein
LSIDWEGQFLFVPASADQDFSTSLFDHFRDLSIDGIRITRETV